MTIFFKDCFAGGTFESQQHIYETNNNICLFAYDKESNNCIDFLWGCYTRTSIKIFLNKYSEVKIANAYGGVCPITRIED